MTTGEPLVVRVRDEADPDADQAAALGRHRHARAGRRRCASAPTPASCPAAGVVGEAMLAIVLAGAYREKFGGDHIDDVRAALAAYERAHRMEATPLAPALVFIGFMGAGKTTGARAAAAALGVRAVDTDRELEQRLGTLDRGLLRAPTASARSARSRRTSSRELLERAAGAGDLARRRRDRLRARARAARAPHRRAARRRRPTPPGGARAASAARWRATASASPRCTPSARRSTRRWPTRCCSTAARETVRRARRAARCARVPPGAKAAVGGRARPATTRSTSATCCDGGVLAAARAGASCVTDETVGAAATPTALGDVDADAAMPPGEEAKTLAQRRARCCAGSPRAGMDHDDHVVALGGGVVGDVGGLLRGGLPARRAASCRCRRRSSPRSTPPTAARPASTCRRARTTPAPTTSPRAVLADPRDAGDAARRRSSPPAGPRWSRRR